MEMFLILAHIKGYLNETQIQILMERFHANKYLTNRERHELAMLLNMKEKRIANWYASMRQRKVAKGMLIQGD